MNPGPQPRLPVADPDLASLLAAHKADIFATLNCHLWGVIDSFDASKGTAVVRVAALRQVPVPQDGQTSFVAKPFPLLTDVPVFLPSGGPGYLAFPVAAGDVCLLLFNDRDEDAFWSTGTVTEPASARMHDLSDGLAIVGFRTAAAPLAGWPTDRAKLAHGGSGLELSDKVKLYSELSSLKDLTQKVIDALTALNLKTGPSAATQIAAAQTAADNLLE